MITGGRTQARDEIFEVVKTVADAGGYPVIWQDELEDVPVDTIYFLAHAQHVSADQASLAGDGAQRRREVLGMVHVTIRVPVKQGGLTVADNLSTIMENAFFGISTPNGVWFRNVIGREVPAKDGNAQTQVSAEFVYQELN